MGSRLVQRQPTNFIAKQKMLQPLTEALSGLAIIKAAADSEIWIPHRLQHAQNAIDRLCQALVTVNHIPATAVCRPGGTECRRVFVQQLEALERLHDKTLKIQVAQEARVPEEQWLPLLGKIGDDFERITTDCISTAYDCYGDFYGAYNHTTAELETGKGWAA
ncbi:MAG: hypothetical protein QNL62_20570 [Gammaproteobacteria bacterium]|nr:hypothetical protein [Gammaproteobacteria bacterium]